MPDPVFCCCRPENQVSYLTLYELDPETGCILSGYDSGLHGAHATCGGNLIHTTGDITRVTLGRRRGWKEIETSDAFLYVVDLSTWEVTPHEFYSHGDPWRDGLDVKQQVAITDTHAFIFRRYAYGGTSPWPVVRGSNVQFYYGWNGPSGLTPEGSHVTNRSPGVDEFTPAGEVVQTHFYDPYAATMSGLSVSADQEWYGEQTRVNRSEVVSPFQTIEHQQRYLRLISASDLTDVSEIYHFPESVYDNPGYPVVNVLGNDATSIYTQVYKTEVGHPGTYDWGLARLSGGELAWNDPTMKLPGRQSAGDRVLSANPLHVASDGISLYCVSTTKGIPSDLHCYNVDNGSVRWSVYAQVGRMCIVDGDIVVADFYSIVRFSAEDGSEAWRLNLGAATSVGALTYESGRLWASPGSRIPFRPSSR